MRLARMSVMLLTGFLALIGPFSPGVAGAGPYGGIVIFGDSLSDSGNAFALLHDVSVPPYDPIPSAPYARGGLHFSNGETWVEQLAEGLGLGPSAGPALRAPGVFTNYAVGAARARTTPENLSTQIDLTTQVDFFLGDFGTRAPADALYVVEVGGNDVRDALVAGAAGRPEDVGPIVQEALSAIGQTIVRLSMAGARTFLVANAPNIALTPAVRGIPGAQAPAQALAEAFNGELERILDGLEQGLGVKIVRLDLFGSVGAVVTNPALAGLSDALTPCLAFGTLVSAACEQPDEHLFWDGIHPTRAGHTFLAGQAWIALTTP